jgi:excisionase family DNA binding protein
MEINSLTLPARVIVTEAARRLGVTAPTAWGMVEKKKLVGFRIGARRYVSAASLNAFIAQINGQCVEAGTGQRAPQVGTV